MKRLTCLGIVLLLVSATLLQAQETALRFGADKKFKIVQFTDVHWVPGNSNSYDAQKCITEVLDAEKPDLVIYTGDVIFGPPAAECLKEALAPTIARRIPFAFTFGNHDDEHDMSRIQICAQLQAMPGNLTGTVEGLSGVSNFILPVKSANGDKDAAVLYCFDSHSYSSLPHIKGYDWIKADQINWYVQQSARFTADNGGEPLPALAFFHIPLPEYNQAATTESAYLIGSRLEKACAPELNTGLFTAMLEAKDVMAMFVGHDHVNDYVAYWKGLLLCYGRFTGGNTVYNGLPGGNGARIIELTEGERALRTWIRLRGDVTIQSIDFPADLVKKED